MNSRTGWRAAMALTMILATSTLARADTEERDLGPIHGVRVSGAFRIEITGQKTQRVEVEAPEERLGQIQTQVEDGILELSITGDYDEDESPKVVLELAACRLIEVSGAVSLTARDLSESALTLELSGAASLNLAGRADRVEMEVSGAGAVRAKDLKARDAVIEVSGTGSVTCFASESIEAEVSGVASVKYFGDPKDVKTDVSGVGRIGPG